MVHTAVPTVVDVATRTVPVNVSRPPLTPIVKSDRNETGPSGAPESENLNVRIPGASSVAAPNGSKMPVPLSTVGIAGFAGDGASSLKSKLSNSKDTGMVAPLIVLKEPTKRIGSIASIAVVPLRLPARP
jgi:hypothetical protein